MRIFFLLFCPPAVIAFVPQRRCETSRRPGDFPSVLHSSSLTPDEVSLSDIGKRVKEEANELFESLSIVSRALLTKKNTVTVEDILQTCDKIDSWEQNPSVFLSHKGQLQKRALEFQRYELLAKLMQNDYDAYTKTASFLSPSRIPRKDLPNVQDVPYDKNAEPGVTFKETQVDGVSLVADCELDDLQYNDSILDKTLLSIFRKLVEKNTGGVKSDKKGIVGLLEQGRTFMLEPGQTPERQHKMVYDTLAGLMTPVLPPFYRIFMSGIVPKLGTEMDGKQIGPWFYAPWLTSFVTPTFFGFLVGPSRPNRRKDGELGGLVVEKCKFLQESGCKGLCLHQCKLPAQQFFQEELGLPLTVTPNFVTQECQWSFGEKPLPVKDDPSFPDGCLAGCQSRKAVAGTRADICSY